MITKKVYLYFPQSETERPIVYELVKQFDLVVNIFRAKVTNEESGYLSLEVTGSQENVDRAFEYLSGFDVNIHAGNSGMVWDENRCGQCGACLVHCPTGALSMVDRDIRQISFNDKACVECLACVEACPFGACSSKF
ncbi:4Fe-4S binding protein [Desulfobulbus rhabdoformis]|jgi:ferredoxin|uniref:NIL domain-containing protein n=1 Tax=Desulfobulbus rhabdoformis TaxID=34032 RepID=UPI0019656289|nr:NIL domain-containing protein [Desulfobulbus rhabdoformis]MBM9613081.1 4Fe-4S binding protein [Desulfobulbus rhabdoformis]